MAIVKWLSHIAKRQGINPRKELLKRFDSVQWLPLQRWRPGGTEYYHVFRVQGAGAPTDDTEIEVMWVRWPEGITKRTLGWHLINEPPTYNEATDLYGWILQLKNCEFIHNEQRNALYYKDIDGKGVLVDREGHVIKTYN